ncbi:Acid sphingomyelinase-like phosphodiesterase 3b-like 2 [Homarus americanus]|uniref:Acid sphingomyelinase-like phosphodiesterase 3b-like 2 n=1 Tax=Homarus americanus TaxID=6706 RepID=A0A8J5NFU2_HOMAM|nr:Acid sphingomyelinase-like phosphodiesterase 3b-like 2 [Homarus americanus]
MDKELSLLLMFMVLWPGIWSLSPPKVSEEDSVADNDSGKTVHLLDKTTIETSTAYEGTFWQITDIHWDHKYSQQGDATRMCHEGYLSSDSNGVYGNYLCDSPWPLVKSALEAMVEIHNKPDFILWTGDNAPHTDDPEPDFTVIFQTVANITGELRSRFQESIPILPVLGNHDAYPRDNFPVAGDEFYGQYLSKGGWSSLLPEDAQQEFRNGGYYGYELPTGVTVLVVNTNLYYGKNPLGIKADDPCGQFAWLRKRLETAQKKNSKVIIAAHAPPGYFERLAIIPYFNDTYNEAYVDLLNEFGTVIMAQIYGHEHTDSFKLFRSPKGDIKSAAFMAPSVTPCYRRSIPGKVAVNPSLRLYLYNSRTLLDYTQYNLDLTVANELLYEEKPIYDDMAELEVVKPEWDVYYRAREAYGLKSLDAVNMAQLYRRLMSDNRLFQEYYLRNSGGYTRFLDGPCDRDCKMHFMCSMVNIKSRDLDKCMGYIDYDTPKVGAQKPQHIKPELNEEL